MATGHVRKRGKKWAYVQYVTDPATGKGKYRWKSGFATKSEAQRALREAITAVEKGTFIEPSKMTYAEYVERIWLPQLDDQLESSTVESYERNMRVHVLPRIGGIKLQQLGPIHLNDLYRDLQSKEDTTTRGSIPESPTSGRWSTATQLSPRSLQTSSPTRSRYPRTLWLQSCGGRRTRRRGKAASPCELFDTSTRSLVDR